MFYDHLSANSLLAKLGRWGWLMRMRLAWKKSQKTLDTSKRLHRNKTRSTGSAGKGTWSQLCHYWDYELGKVQVRQAWGVWNVLARWRLQPGLKLWFPQTQGGVQSFWNGWTAFCLSWYNFVIMVPRARQRGAKKSQIIYQCYIKWYCTSVWMTILHPSKASVSFNRRYSSEKWKHIFFMKLFIIRCGVPERQVSLMGCAVKGRNNCVWVVHV